MKALFVYEQDLFDPTPSIPSLEGKVIFITGGTAGLGKATLTALLSHHPSHIYFSGRSLSAATSLIASLTSPNNNEQPPPLTFVQMDLTSLASVKRSVSQTFAHPRLDILINNAGIMAGAPGLSTDGYEIQFATNHLGHAMLVRALMPVLERTASEPGSDVRIVNLTSVGYQGHPSGGIAFPALRTTQTGPPILGEWTRYGQSKLANILFTTELARRHPAITTVAIHPGVVDTGLVTNQSRLNRLIVYLPNKLMGAPMLTPEQGSWNQLWAAAAAKKGQLVNGAFYMPVGKLANDQLDTCATDEKLAGVLWRWTEDVLAGFD